MRIDIHSQSETQRALNQPSKQREVNETVYSLIDSVFANEKQPVRFAQPAPRLPLIRPQPQLSLSVRSGPARVVVTYLRNMHGMTAHGARSILSQCTRVTNGKTGNLLQRQVRFRMEQQRRWRLQLPEMGSAKG